MTTLAAVIAIVSTCSCVVLGQRVSCEPGASPHPGPTCRPMEQMDVHCSSNFNKCLDRCFGPNARVVDNTVRGCTRCRPNDCSGCPEDSCTGGRCNGSTTNTNVNVTYKLVPYKFKYFKLSVQLPAVPRVRYYTLELKLHPRNLPQCVCTNETSFDFTIKYQLRADELSLNVKSLSDELVFSRKIPFPRHCSDIERGVPYDSNTCGLPRLQKPYNTLLLCNETHTTISWNKTMSYIRPDNNQSLYIESKKFYLTVQLGDDSKIDFVVLNASSVTLNTTAAMNISLYGYTHCSGLQDRTLSLPEVGCSLPLRISNRGPGICQDSTFTSSVTLTPPLYTHTPLPTSLPLKSKPNDTDSLIAAALTAGVGVPVLIVMVTLFTVAIIKLLRVPKKVSPFSSQNCALAVYSPSTSEQEKLVTMKSLASVRNLNPGLKLFLQDERSPQQSLSDWISEHHKNASTVFCVCNKEFGRDWDSKSEKGVAAVHILKMLFQGDCSPEKYAVVLSKPADKVFVPALLKALPHINLVDATSLMKFTVK